MMKLSGRVLWLTEDPSALRSQLAGEDPGFDPASPPRLTFGVNTDAMISGAACTLGYTPSILGPYFLENFQEVVAKDAIAKGGFEVIVGGDAYGSGSSREVAVVAHQGAGVKLVVAASFQRIFQENLVYSGLPFTTDFGVVARLQEGEDVDLSALQDDLPPFFRDVARAGGLLAYGHALLRHEAEGTTKATLDLSAHPPRPQTSAEKLIARRAYRGPGNPDGVPSVKPGDQLLCRVGFRGVHEYTAGMVMSLYEEAFGRAPIARPEAVAAFEDHFVLIGEDTVPLRVKDQRLAPARALRDEMVVACERAGLKIHGPGRDLEPGVCHRIVLERYALPGDIIVLTDSHTPTAGVLGAFAFGIGSTAMAFALRTGLVPVTVPKTVRVIVRGQHDGTLSPKDLILHLIGDPYFREEQWRTSATDTCIVQFGGPGLEGWDVDELSVLTNMTVEGGLMTGIVEPCAALRDFLAKRHPNEVASLEERFAYPDEGAEYAHVVEIDLAEVPVTVATPGDSRNRAPLAGLVGTPVHNVVIASCTGGSLADLRAVAAVLEGRSFAAGVRVTVTPSSTEVSRIAEAEGLLASFRSKGAVVTPPGCGSCIGNGPGIPAPGETTASTTNRNFDRRMGAPGPVFLVSPAVAAASAVCGALTDPRALPPVP